MSDQDHADEVVLDERQAQHTLIIRGTIPTQQLGDEMSSRLQTLMAFMSEHNVQASGPLYVRYHTFDMTETDVEHGIPVATPVEGDSSVLASQLEAGPAISTWHYGSHEKLGDAYGRIENWMKENNRESSNPAIEVYHWMDLNKPEQSATWGDPSTWRVELVQPVK